MYLCFWCCFCAWVPTGALAQSEPLQPGDTLQISVLQDPKLDRQVVVAPDGMIAFPLAGHIKAAGITPQSLENLLRGRASEKLHREARTSRFRWPRSIRPRQPNSRPRVYISGEVLKPGPYPLKPPITIAQAIALAGGLSPFAASPADSGSSQY